MVFALQIPAPRSPSHPIRSLQPPQIEPQAPQVDVELGVAADAHLGPTPKEKGLDSRNGRTALNGEVKQNATKHYKHTKNGQVIACLLRLRLFFVCRLKYQWVKGQWKMPETSWVWPAWRANRIKYDAQRNHFFVVVTCWDLYISGSENWWIEAPAAWVLSSTEHENCNMKSKNSWTGDSTRQTMIDFTNSQSNQSNQTNQNLCSRFSPKKLLPSAHHPIISPKKCPPAPDVSSPQSWWIRCASVPSTELQLLALRATELWKIPTLPQRSLGKP